MLEELAEELRRYQTRRLRRGAVGVVACRPAAPGCSYQTEGNKSRSRLCLCGSCHAPVTFSDDVYCPWCAADPATVEETCTL